MGAAAIRKHLRRLADGKRAAISARFFKTGPGEYGEGDRFVGIRVPVLRRLARHYQATPVDQIRVLLASPVHEQRLLALLLLVRAFGQADPAGQRKIYRLYLAQLRWINNWDLVDSSAGPIVGAYLQDRSRKPLHRLARSKNLWRRRIAVLATFHFIKNREYAETLALAKLLLKDQEDLIHKAVGWMLREIGKRDRTSLEKFLRRHHQTMPRTMLRYAIERLPKAMRRRYLDGDG